jgi:hypothetical protein
MSDQAGTETQAPAAGEEQRIPVTADIGATDEKAAPESSGKATAPMPTEKAQEAASAIEYETTNRPDLDVALQFIGRMGIGPDHKAMQSAMDGDFTFMEATLAAMGDKAKGFETYLALAKSAYKSISEESKVKADKDTAAILSAFGEDPAKAAAKWAEVQAWARQNAEPDEKAAVNAALKAGGIAAKAMAHYLGMLHDNAAGTQVQGKAAVAPTASRGAAPAAAEFTARVYAEAVSDLSRRIGAHNLAGSPEYAQLQAKRAAYKAATGR